MDYVTRLKDLITKIEQTNLSVESKNQIYKIIRDNLQNLTSPILIKYMDKKKLMYLSEHFDDITPGRYMDLLLDAVKDENYTQDFNKAAKALLDKFEQALEESGLTQP